MNFTIGPIIIGVLIVISGFSSLDTVNHTKEKPNEINLASIKSIQSLDNAHIKVRWHTALYDSLFYEYSEKKNNKDKKPDSSTRLNSVFYPIVVNSKKRKNILVLVKTNRFEYLADIPKRNRKEAGVTGIIKEASISMGGKEQQFIIDNFPGLKLDKLLVLKEGEKPPKFAAVILTIVVGISLLLFGAYRTISRIRNPAPDTATNENASAVNVSLENVNTDSSAPWTERNKDLSDAIELSNFRPQEAIEKINKILNDGININAANENNVTALGIAKYHEVPYAVLKLLVASGGKVQEK